MFLISPFIEVNNFLIGSSSSFDHLHVILFSLTFFGIIFFFFVWAIDTFLRPWNYFLFVCSFCRPTVPTIWHRAFLSFLWLFRFCSFCFLSIPSFFYFVFFRLGHHISLCNDILADICSVLNWFLFVLRVEIVFRKCEKRERENVCVSR